MRLTNKSSFSDKLVRAVIRFARPPGIKRFTVGVYDLRYGDYKGNGNRKGVKVWINQRRKYPAKMRVYQYGQLKGRRYYLASKTEALIYVMAHELMHVKQGQRGNLRGRVWGARGRYSEIETESYAIRKLREYRRES